MDAFGPFAQALFVRLCDHLQRYAALGIVDPVKALKDNLYDLIKSAARDWHNSCSTSSSWTL